VVRAAAVTLVLALSGIWATGCRESAEDVRGRLGDHEVFSLLPGARVLESACFPGDAFSAPRCRQWVAASGDVEEIKAAYEQRFLNEGWELVCECHESSPFVLGLVMRNSSHRFSVSFMPGAAYYEPLEPGENLVLSIVVSDRKE